MVCVLYNKKLKFRSYNGNGMLCCCFFKYSDILGIRFFFSVNLKPLFARASVCM